MDWMYPYLSPHGLILKLNPGPLPRLAETPTREDHEYWRRYAGRLVGDWLIEEMPVKTV